MKKIAVITGASSGMGKRFAETVDQYGTFDEVWVVARQQDRLEALRATAPFPIRVLAMDLTDRASFDTYKTALAEEPVQVGLLMNCSGYGKFSAVLDTPLEVNLNMTDLNCQAVVAMCQLTAPYMPRGSQIINIASVAKLSPRERDIISLRFGLNGRKELTQKEVADHLGISQSYISRLEKRIILRLRREIMKMT